MNMVSNCTISDCDCETNNLLLRIHDLKCLEPLDLAVSKTSKDVSGREVPLHQVITDFEVRYRRCVSHHHHHISVMELGHLLTRSCLTYPEVSSKVCHDSFCQLGNSVSLPWVNLLQGILFTCCIQFLLHSSNLSKISVIFNSFAICAFVL